MNFIESIKLDMYSAMKAGQKEKANTLRTLMAKLKDHQINAQKTITEQDGISVVKTLVKQRIEAAEMYEKAGREGLANKEKAEYKILNSYLPQMMNEESIRELVQTVINETKAKDISEMGKVMPLVMQRGSGSVDGRVANKILRELLG
ncbi:MAG: GatB/YqeY domain-containing protein [Candidatus Neomarinimicrobiota bacterium]